MKKFYLVLTFCSLLYSCSQKADQIITQIEGDSLEDQMIQSYNAGVEALDRGDVMFATKKFNEAELLFPQSDWAPKASLMASYAYWTQSYYGNSIKELERFIRLYPKNKNLDYAYYLMAINYYDSIVDETKDLRPLKEAKKNFTLIINKFPDSDYAVDGSYKLELIEDILAAKEMYVARHYIKKEKWIAAINRLKFVLVNYDTTVYIEEALHRLVEIYYIIGLENEAKKYATTLGYNYKSSEWYEKSYEVFNKDYSKSRKNKELKSKKKNKKKLLDRIKSFF